MFDIGFWELMIIGVVALLVVGPERFPGMIKKVGYWIGQFRRIASSVKSEIQVEVDKAEQLQNLLDEQKQILKRNADVDLTQPAVKPKPTVESDSPPQAIGKHSDNESSSATNTTPQTETQNKSS